MAQGTVKDNVRDELDEAAGRGRREREVRREATPKEVRQPGSGGSRITSRTSGPRRKSAASQNSHSVEG